jgi:uncharacterized protein
VEGLTALYVYGPLGVWAAAATVGVVTLYRDIGRLRDACAADTATLHEAHATKVETLGKDAGAALTTSVAQFSQQLREQNERHERQMAEATQRSFNIMTTLADKMSTLADALTRNRR